MNTYKMVIVVSLFALSCSTVNNKSISADTDTMESETARQSRLDSLHKVTVSETIQTRKITDPPKTVSKKVERADSKN